MKSSFLVAILLVTINDCFSQEKIFQSTCDCFAKLPASNLDKIDFQFAIESCFDQAEAKAISLKSKDSSETFIRKFLVKLAADCQHYNKAKTISDKLTLQKSEMKIKDRKTCKQMMLTGDFKDKRRNDKITMSMRDSVQFVKFGDDGTYTKYKIEWIDDCSYKTIFIESTRPLENSLVSKGDEREVRIIDIRDNEVTYEVGMFGRWFAGKLTKIK